MFNSSYFFFYIYINMVVVIKNLIQKLTKTEKDKYERKIKI